MRGNEKKSTNAPRRTPTPPHSTDFIASTNTNRCQYLSAEKRPTRDSLCAPSIENQSIENQSVSQSVHRSVSPSIENQSVGPSIRQSFDQTVRRSRISQSVSPSIRQSIDRESIDRATRRKQRAPVPDTAALIQIADSPHPAVAIPTPGVPPLLPVCLLLSGCATVRYCVALRKRCRFSANSGQQRARRYRELVFASSRTCPHTRS